MMSGEAMTEWTVSWQIQVDGTDPVDAARTAMYLLTRDGSIAHVFEVVERGRDVIEGVTVDLDGIDGHPEADRPELVLTDGTRWDYDRGEWIVPEVAG